MADQHAPTPRVDPIMAPRGASPAEASHPDTPLEGERWHRYEGNLAPWWLGLIWIAFFVFGVTYLLRNLTD